jgi:hypothetical protein
MDICHKDRISNRDRIGMLMELSRQKHVCVLESPYKFSSIPCQGPVAFLLVVGSANPSIIPISTSTSRRHRWFSVIDRDFEWMSQSQVMGTRPFPTISKRQPMSLDRSRCPRTSLKRIWIMPGSLVLTCIRCHPSTKIFQSRRDNLFFLARSCSSAREFHPSFSPFSGMANAPPAYVLCWTQMF